MEAPVIDKVFLPEHIGKNVIELYESGVVHREGTLVAISEDGRYGKYRYGWLGWTEWACANDCLFVK